MARTRTLAATVTTSIVVLFGLELLRVMFSSLDFVLVDAGGASPLLAGAVAVVIGLFGTVGVTLRRSPLRGVALLVGSRLAVQIFSTPVVDLWWSVVGVAVFAALVPTLAHDAVGVLSGVIADRGIMGALGTVDLTLQRGVWPVVVVVGIGVAAVWRATPVPPDDRTGAGRALLGLGPWIALELLVFGNIGFAGSVTGWSLPGAALLTTAGGLVGLVTLYAVSGRCRAASPLAAFALTAAALAMPFVSGTWAAAVILVGSITAVMLLPSLLQSDGWGGVFWMVGGILMLFAYFAPFNYPLGYRSAAVLPVAAGLIAAASLYSDSPVLLRRSWGWLGGVVVFALLPFVVGTSPAPNSSSSDAVRVMTYNLHQGFAVDGRFSLEEIAAVIEESGADVVALQEVSRGWVTDGEVDMAAWLSRRLGMFFVAGPTADRQWGNAVLSRNPIVSFEVHPLPRPDQPLRRGYIDAMIELGDTDLRVLVTHFDHVDGHDDVRAEEARALVAAWRESPRTVVAGDLNSTPDDEAIQILRSSGLVDAGVTGAMATSPADDPRRRIDYVWMSPDIRFEDVGVIETTVSDHLPVVVGIDL